MKEYALTPKIFKYLSSRLGSDFKCAHCEKPFKEGEAVVSSRNNFAGVKLRHRSCYEEMKY